MELFLDFLHHNPEVFIYLLFAIALPLTKVFAESSFSLREDDSPAE